MGLHNQQYVQPKGSNIISESASTAQKQQSRLFQVQVYFYKNQSNFVQ